MKQSSKDILKRHGWRIDRALHNFIYFYFHEQYVFVARILTKTTVVLLSWFKPIKIVPNAVFNRYHSKILSTSDVTKILTLNEDIDLGRDLNKQVLPFKYANKILFRNPKLIATMDCPCTLNQKESERCHPVRRCIAIGQDFAPIWLEHCKEKYNAIQITQEEALDIIKESRKTGHITNAFLKVATGGLTGIICNCCPKCCVEIEATKLSKKIDKSISQYAPSGYSVKHDSSVCTLCGECEKACHFEAIKIEDEKFIYDRDACMGCELCVESCPSEALQLYNDPDKLLPLDLELLKEEFEKK
ncbi:MAG: 4Fe-4S binding protein [Desulfobacterales bacterium]